MFLGIYLFSAPFLFQLGTAVCTHHLLMTKFRTAARLAITTGLLAGVVAWIALQMQLIPSQSAFNRESNLHTVESLALALSNEVNSRQHDDAGTIPRLREIVRTCAELHDRIEQIHLTDRSGKTVFKTACKSKHDSCQSDPKQMATIDLRPRQDILGEVAVCFNNVEASAGAGYFSRSLGVIGFLAGAVALACWLLFSNALRYLSPSEDIPRRVIAALETLTEGVVLLKPSGAISHCNDAFCDLISDGANDQTLSPETMVGNDLQKYNWRLADPNGDQAFAWEQCIKFRKAVVGQVVTLTTESGTSQLSVNASPILTSKGVCQGALISFGNVTETENQRAALEKTLETVEHQNQQLTFLASYDTLTKCLNRREFFNIFDRSWQESRA